MAVSPSPPSRSAVTDPAPRLGLRSRLAVSTGRAVAAASRLTHLGSGSVIGGRASLAVDPRLLRHLTADTGREVVLISATNGKTTTTRLLAAALASDRPVVSNALGANMPPGHVAAIGGTDPAATAVLEVDERWLGRVLADTRAGTVVLLNLSRDQLDRSFEVRQVAERWRDALQAYPPTRVVANADDPLVTWAASGASDTTTDVVWVGTGQSWLEDATGCPACGARLELDEGPWHCVSCDLARPAPSVTLDGRTVVDGSGGRTELRLALPGRVNRVNAAMALAAATALGVDPAHATAAMSTITDVAGRYRVVDVDGSKVRLLLAKNPAGWQEAIEMLAPAPQPVIVSINARVADGHDPSWLWDVPFERLADRLVVAAGERRHDLAVRLHYAEVDHVIADSLRDAVRAAASPGVDVAANYTAFQEYLEEVGG
jgi:lipid II isoglutaminyl synthase (glutamine-hydrolysing)